MNNNTNELECFVFRTNISDKREVKNISESLDIIPGIIEWSVDLEDWEKVLRVVGTQINIEIIRNALQAHHVEIEEMPV